MLAAASEDAGQTWALEMQKILYDGFRTEQGAIEFCRIRSYLSSLQKNQINLFDGIVQALAGKPWLPAPETSAAQEKTLSAPHQEK